MKTLSKVIALLFLLAFLMSFSSVDPDTIIKKSNNVYFSCPQNSNYSVVLKTMGGQNISASQVQPSTQYQIVITYSGSYVCCANVAYCVVNAYGFTGGCNDATSGSTTINITTDSALPPFGIIGVVGPTDCSGSPSSVDIDHTKQIP